MLTVCKYGFSQHEYEPLSHVTTDVVSIEETGFKKRFSRSGWKSIYNYDSSLIKRHLNYFKNDLRMDKSFTYFVSNSSKRVKEVDNLNDHFRIQITHFNKTGKIAKSLHFLDSDTLKPYLKEQEFIYYPFGEIKSFYSISFPNRDSTCYEFKYENEMVIEISILRNCSQLVKRIMFQYNSTGFPVKQIIDYIDRDAIITGVKSENGFQRFSYVYDKHGNWIKRFFVNSRGRKTLDRKRKIFYK